MRDTLSLTGVLGPEKSLQLHASRTHHSTEALDRKSLEESGRGRREGIPSVRKQGGAKTEQATPVSEVLASQAQQPKLRTPAPT